MVSAIRNCARTVALRTKAAVLTRGKSVEAGDHLLEVLGTIIIAVVILVLFKDQIVGIFNNSLGQTSTAIDGLVDNLGAGGGGGGGG